MSTGTPADRKPGGDAQVVDGAVERSTVDDLAAILDPLVVEPSAVGTLPPMWHVALLLPVWPQSDLGPDGHPRSGLPAPPGPGRRRMFAGARVSLLHPLHVGEPASRRSEVIGSSESVGRSGRLTFMTLRHELSQAGRVCIVDEQDIVYRDPAGASVGRGVPVPAPAPPAQPPPADPVADTELAFDVDPVVLFRFSAVTRNAHRIHYDTAYAATEGYRDLVVHGPLQAVLLAAALQRSSGPLAGTVLRYRLTAPAIGPQRLRIRAGAGEQPWAEVRDADGIVTATMVREVGA